MRSDDTAKKMYAGIAIIVLLSVCLCVTTFALVYATVNMDDNIFQMGHVEIDLNGNEPVIQEDEFLFEPGMTVVKPFYIQSKSSWPVWVKFYFENVRGGLADVMEISILDKDEVIAKGTMNTLTRELAQAMPRELAVGEKKWLIIQFHFPEDAGNTAQGMDLEFDFCADAVQTKNNPEKVFD